MYRDLAAITSVMSNLQAITPPIAQVLRLEPHVVVSNRTGIPLQLMHYSSGASVQRLGNKATGVQPSRGQQPQRAGPGLKGVVARPDQDWTSCIDIPSGELC